MVEATRLAGDKHFPDLEELPLKHIGANLVSIRNLLANP